MQIHAMGGGIGFTVRHTRESSQAELEKLFLKRLRRMLRAGTTLVEAKSGYGLDLDTEVKMLKVIHEAKGKQPIDIVANYCGAHSVPKGVTEKDAAKNIIEEFLPEIIKLKEQGFYYYYYYCYFYYYYFYYYYCYNYYYILLLYFFTLFPA